MLIHDDSIDCSISTVIHHMRRVLSMGNLALTGATLVPWLLLVVMLGRVARRRHHSHALTHKILMSGVLLLLLLPARLLYFFSPVH